MVFKWIVEHISFLSDESMREPHVDDAGTVNPFLRP